MVSFKVTVVSALALAAGSAVAKPWGYGGMDHGNDNGAVAVAQNANVNKNVNTNV